MTPERLAECRECRAIVTQLLAVEPAGRCPDHGFVTLHDAQRAHIRDLEAQLAAAREALTRIAFEDEVVYLGCADMPFCQGTHAEHCPVRIARDVLATATPPSPEVGAREASLVRRALVSHAMWCAFQMGAGLPFNEEPTEAQMQSQIDGLRAFDANPSMTAEENHANWMRFKLANGWRYGPVKDETAKTHPDLVPFGDLPRIEALKDEMDLMSRRVGVLATATPPSPEVKE